MADIKNGWIVQSFMEQTDSREGMPMQWRAPGANILIQALSEELDQLLARSDQLGALKQKRSAIRRYGFLIPFWLVFVLLALEQIALLINVPAYRDPDKYPAMLTIPFIGATILGCLCFWLVEAIRWLLPSQRHLAWEERRIEKDFARIRRGVPAPSRQ